MKTSKPLLQKSLSGTNAFPDNLHNNHEGTLSLKMELTTGVQKLKSVAVRMIMGKKQFPFGFILKSIVLTLASILFISANSQPTFRWAQKIDVHKELYAVHTVKTDAAGNIYVLATFKGQILFPSGVINLDNGLSPSLYGILLAKYSASGSAIWGYKVDSVYIGGGAYGLDLEVDSFGNSYIGNFQQPNDGLFYLSKYNSNGTKLWSRNIVPGPSQQTITVGTPHLALNKNQSQIILSCAITGGIDANLGNGIIIATGGVTIVHYNASNGNTIRGKKIAIGGAPEGIAISNDSSIFIAESNRFYKLNYNDSLLWTKNISSIGLTGIVTDGSNCFVAGSFGGGLVQLDGLVASSNYNQDFFLAKVDANGQSVYLRSGSNGVTNGNARIERIAIDKYNALYLSGNSSETVGIPAYTINFPNEHFILKYDSIGNTIGGFQYNTNLTTAYVNLDRPALHIDHALNIYCAGVYKPLAHIGTDSLLNNFTNRDGFLFKLEQCSISPPQVISTGPTTVCFGDSVTFTTGPASSYQWSNGAFTQSIKVTTPGNYSVTITDNNQCSAVSAITSVTVNPVPTAPVITASGPSTFCVGGNVILTSNATNNNFWSNGAITQSITIYNTTTVTDTVYNGPNCFAVSNPLTITVHSNPAIPIITATGPTIVCTGDTVSLSTNMAHSYLWSNGATTQSLKIDATGSYSVTITDNNNCTAASAGTQVTVNPVPAIPIITVSGATTFCWGESVILSSNTAGNNFWSNGATDQSITIFNSATLTDTVFNPFGCSTISQPISVVVNPNPSTPDLAFSHDTICANDSSQICAPSGFVGYEWNNGLHSTCIYAASAGNYYLTVTDSNNCSSESNHLAIAVYPASTVAISVNGDTLNTFNGIGYQWYRNEVPIPNAVTSTWIAQGEGSYSVEITDSNGCHAFSSSITMNTVGIHPLRLAEITVYPNPLGEGNWILSAPADFVGSEISVFDIAGRKVWGQTISGNRTELTFNAAKGLYVLRLLHNGQPAFLQLLKQ